MANNTEPRHRGEPSPCAAETGTELDEDDLVPLDRPPIPPGPARAVREPHLPAPRATRPLGYSAKAR
ncbi:hypothetical protein [Saccharopolyspora rectivirgula]|uniref:Uncharacterized protein n=1 Tax=Saccharopolyspora rectivirgula TaxID=28042 RepID=A0A073B058_9PSEU|nr:hypothetical protein [Saccharopolyspora rectivirgula]KEI45413.1 hypothetical protein GU90_04755 [Saccharopolyspora rectivirgula]